MDHLDENISSSSFCRGRGLDGMGMRGGKISLIRRKRKEEDFRVRVRLSRFSLTGGPERGEFKSERGIRPI